VDIMQREPVAVIGAIEVAVVALIGVLAAMLEWDAELSASVVAAASAVIIAIGTIWQRMAVDSPETVAKKVEDALNAPPPQ
jgi:uncharacterized membrane protein